MRARPVFEVGAGLLAAAISTYLVARSMTDAAIRRLIGAR